MPHCLSPRSLDYQSAKITGNSSLSLKLPRLHHFSGRVSPTEGVNDWIHNNTPWKVFYHGCSSIVSLLDDFVEVAVDILDPVQCSAKGMNHHVFKEKYGDKFVFWGDGVDTQRTLPFGTSQEVRREVRERCQIFGEGGKLRL